MLKRYASILLLCILFFSCKKSKTSDSDLRCYNVEAAFNTETKEVCIDSLVYDISIIPLETNEDILIRNIIRVYFYRNLLFIVQSNRCSVFDIQGKYLYDIGKQGNGPREFISIRCLFFYDDIVGLYDSSKQKMLYYGINSDFIRDFPMSDGYYCQINVIKNNVLVGYIPVGANEMLKRLSFFDSTGQTIDSVLHYKNLPVPKKLGLTVGDDNFFIYNGATYLKEGCYDTVYRISDDMKLIPEYTITTGKHAVNYEDKVLYPEKYHNGGRTVVRFENERYIIISSNKLPLRYLLIDKKTDRIINASFIYNEEMNSIFENSTTREYVINNQFALKEIPPFFMIRGISEDGKIAFDFEFLKEFPDNNPVIVMVRFKE